MNHPYTITRRKWQKPDEGTMEYRGVRVDFDFSLPDRPGVHIDATVKYPAEDDIDMLATLPGLLPHDVDAGLAEWRRRFDALVSRLAVMLARAGEPVPTTTGDGVAVQLGPALESAGVVVDTDAPGATAWVLPGGVCTVAVDGPALRLAGGVA